MASAPHATVRARTQHGALAPLALPQEVWELCVTEGNADALFGVDRASREAVIRVIGKQQALNREQAIAYVRVVHLGQRIFLDGPAGTGKSYLVKAMAAVALRRWGAGSMAIVAPTGAAAQVASSRVLMASTIHRAFNIRTRKRAVDEPSVHVPTEAEEQSLGETEEPPMTDAGGHGATPSELELALAYDPDALSAATPAEHLCGLETVVLDRTTRTRLSKPLRVLVIDEVSMTSRRMLELCDQALRVARGHDAPFGGCAVVMSGDFYQLKPIAKASTGDAGESVWAFTSPVFPDRTHTVQLVQQVRQAADPEFGGFLNRLRVGECTEQDLAWFNRSVTRRGDQPVPDHTLMLTPSHKKNNAENVAQLSKLPGELCVSRETRACVAVVSTSPWRTERLDPQRLRFAPTYPYVDERIELKVGARVRCKRNIYTGTWPERTLSVANGQRGTALRIESEIVDPPGHSNDADGADAPGHRRTVVRVLWDKIGDMQAYTTTVHCVVHARRQAHKTDEGHPVLAMSYQLPLALGFAVTIHSAQGASVDAPLCVDHRAFTCVPDMRRPTEKHWFRTYGSAYVAISRVTRLAHLRLLAPLTAQQARADPEVLRRFGPRSNIARNAATEPVDERAA